MTLALHPLTVLLSLPDIFLQPRPGTDGALALAMANVIIDEDLYNHDFVDNWTHGFEEYREYVAQFTPEVAEEITWVPADKIREAARMWAEAGQGTLWCGLPRYRSSYQRRPEHSRDSAARRAHGLLRRRGVHESKRP